MKKSWRYFWWLLVAVFGVTLLTLGTEKTFSAWSVKTEHPLFPDTRGITAGLESLGLGKDPLVENPCDPWHRTLNYPRVWLSLSYFGVDQSHTVMIGRILIGLFLVGLLLFPPPDLNGIGFTLILLTVFSPASILGMERGNIDALIFFLMALAVISMSMKSARAKQFAIISVYLAFILKLYPMFAMSIILRLNKSRFIKALAWVTPLILVYLILIWNDLGLIQKATPKATGLSYGMNVMWMNISGYGATIGRLAQLAAYLGVGVAAALLWLGCRSGSAAFSKLELSSKALSAFHVGAGIYGGTFLLGNNWDYRLIFLIMTLPLLGQLIISPCHLFRWLAVVLSIAVVISFWHITFIQLCSGLTYGSKICVFFDECANWTVFLVLGFMFGSSVPVWITSLVNGGGGDSLKRH